MTPLYLTCGLDPEVADHYIVRPQALNYNLADSTAAALVHGWSLVAPAGLSLVSCPDPTHSNEEKGLVFWYSSSNFWGLVQNSGKPIRIVPCDLEK